MGISEYDVSDDVLNDVLASLSRILKTLFSLFDRAGVAQEEFPLLEEVFQAFPGERAA